MQRPFSQACENNKNPILDILRHSFADIAEVLEIASGTGQHAAFFAAQLPHLRWQCSDVADNLPGIQAWIDWAQLPNLPAPLTLDVTQRPWPMQQVQAVFCANAVHIMSWSAVQAMFAGLEEILSEHATVVFYGPFNYAGRYTSDSNAAFDQWLQARDPASGIRDFEAIVALASSIKLELRADHAMPANNRTLHFQR